MPFTSAVDGRGPAIGWEPSIHILAYIIVKCIVANILTTTNCNVVKISYILSIFNPNKLYIINKNDLVIINNNPIIIVTIKNIVCDFDTLYTEPINE